MRHCVWLGSRSRFFRPKAVGFTQLLGVNSRAASGSKHAPWLRMKRDGPARIPLHEAGEGGFAQRNRVRCGRQVERFRRRLRRRGDRQQRSAGRSSPHLFAVQQRPAPHPTSLREATLSSFVERDSHRIVAANSKMSAHDSELRGEGFAPHRRASSQDVSTCRQPKAGKAVCLVAADRRRGAEAWPPWRLRPWKTRSSPA